jgi:L-ascorbate metabolism protein UlaG (beta-lactamase superfamily)
MPSAQATLTLIGGPTLLIEIDGYRLLTDPTFDAPGPYPSDSIVLEKRAGPAMSPDSIGRIDAVLLSHDQHADNLDPAGREYLARAPVVLTTRVGAERLGNGAVGLAPWQEFALERDGAEPLLVTGAPARHGPAGVEPIAGEVTGFLLGAREPGDLVYVTGDTVWYDGVAEVARRFKPRLVVPFAGSAKTRGAFHLTMDANDVIETAAAFPTAWLAPIHTDGWAHFSETGDELSRALETFKLGSRLVRLAPGVATAVAL